MSLDGQPTPSEVFPSYNTHILVTSDRPTALGWMSWFVNQISTGRLWEAALSPPPFIGWVSLTDRTVLESCPTYCAARATSADVQAHMHALWHGLPPGKGSEDFPLLDAALEHFKRTNTVPPGSLFVLDNLLMLGIDIARQGRLYGGAAALARWCLRNKITLLALHTMAKQPRESDKRYLHVVDLAYGDVHLTHVVGTKFILLDPAMGGRRDTAYTLHVIPSRGRAQVHYFTSTATGEFHQVVRPENLPVSLSDGEQVVMEALLKNDDLAPAGQGAVLTELLGYLEATDVTPRSRQTLQRLLPKMVRMGTLEKIGGKYRRLQLSS